MVLTLLSERVSAHLQLGKNEYQISPYRHQVALQVKKYPFAFEKELFSSSPASDNAPALPHNSEATPWCQ